MILSLVYPFLCKKIDKYYCEHNVLRAYYFALYSFEKLHELKENLISIFTFDP